MRDEPDELDAVDGVVLVLECRCGREYSWRLGVEEPPDCPTCGPDDSSGP